MTDKCCKTCVFFVDLGYGECRRYPEAMLWIPPMTKEKPEKHWCGEHTAEVIKGEPTVTEESFTITTSDERVITTLRDVFRDQRILRLDGKSWVAVDVVVENETSDADGDMYFQKCKTGRMIATAVFKPRKDTV